jgi:hypothetical protein
MRIWTRALNSLNSQWMESKRQVSRAMIYLGSTTLRARKIQRI